MEDIFKKIIINLIFIVYFLKDVELSIFKNLEFSMMFLLVIVLFNVLIDCFSKED